MTKIVVYSFDHDIGAIIARLERHARAADQTAIATELREAAVFRKEAERKQFEELKVRCESWLKPSDVKNVHIHRVQARLAGTCDWIASNDAYRKWADEACSTAHDRLLVISGTHGCGKSILASSIVVRLDETDQHTLFFAFSSLIESRQTAENLIRTLLVQLLQGTTDRKRLGIIQNLRLAGQPAASELWEALESIISSLTKPVYCVIDGIDECIDFNHSMAPRIMHILASCPHLHILLLGRPHSIQACSKYLDTLAIDITSALTNQDIEAFVDHEIAKSDILSHPGLCKDISGTLRAKSDGMFLWAKLMVDDLGKSSSKSEVYRRLGVLPRGLEEAYRLVFLRLIQNLDKFELCLAQTTLAFAAASCRPLRFDELRYFHALHCRSSDFKAKPLEEYLLLQPPQKILEISGGLLSLTDGLLCLIHSSVRDFLVRPEDQWVSQSDRAILDFRVGITEAHRSLARLSLDYLKWTYCEIENARYGTLQSVQSLRDSYLLLEYATLYTFYHLNRSGPLCPMTLTKISSVLESTQSVFWVEHFAHFLFADLTLDAQIVEFMNLQGLLADPGLDMRFFAIFERNLKEMTDRFRMSGNDEESRIEQWEMLSGLVTDAKSEIFGRGQSNEMAQPTAPALEPDPAQDELQATFYGSKASPEDSSVTISRMLDLLKGQGPLSVAHQIEIFLRLHSSLRKARSLSDPLKLIFQLIVRKAPCIPVYALFGVGDFYHRFGKFQEALEIYSIAYKKIEYVDTARKAWLQESIGDCYYQKDMIIEALEFNEKAFLGYESLYGARHKKTINSLYWMLRCNFELSLDTEVLRLCDKICLGQDFVPELDMSLNIDIHYYRSRVYSCAEDSSNEAHTRKCLEMMLIKFHESHSKDGNQSARILESFGLAYGAIGEYNIALEFFQLAVQANRKKYGTHGYATLVDHYNIADTYWTLYRDQEAKELLETTYADLRRFFPERTLTRRARDALVNQTFTNDESSECSSLNSSSPVP